MFEDEMMKKLELLEPQNVDVSDFNYITFGCDCTGGCTDNCYDCSENSRNQW